MAYRVIIMLVRSGRDKGRDANGCRSVERYHVPARTNKSGRRRAESMSYWENKQRNADRINEAYCARLKRHEEQQKAERMAWYAERFPKDQRIVYRGYGLVTDNHGYTWTIAGLGYAGLLGLREAKRAVDDYFRAVNAQKRFEELAEL